MGIRLIINLNHEYNGELLQTKTMHGTMLGFTMDIKPTRNGTFNGGRMRLFLSYLYVWENMLIINT